MMANALERWRESTATMNGCRIAGIAVGAVVLGFVLINVPDILRYIRISMM